MHPVDREKFVLRFSPRRKGSIWAQNNVRRVLEMAQKRKMCKAGLAVLPPELLHQVICAGKDGKRVNR